MASAAAAVERMAGVGALEGHTAWAVVEEPHRVAAEVEVPRRELAAVEAPRMVGVGAEVEAAVRRKALVEVEVPRRVEAAAAVRCRVVERVVARRMVSALAPADKSAVEGCKDEVMDMVEERRMAAVVDEEHKVLALVDRSEAEHTALAPVGTFGAERMVWVEVCIPAVVSHNHRLRLRTDHLRRHIDYHLRLHTGHLRLRIGHHHHHRRRHSLRTDHQERLVIERQNRLPVQHLTPSHLGHRLSG